MKSISDRMLWVALLGFACAIQAEPVQVSGVDTVEQMQSLVTDKELPHSARVAKYVRNITNPNGFGESISINADVFYKKDGDVKAESGDKLEYAIVISATNEDIEGVSVKDFIPAYTEYVPDSTRINDVKIDDIEGKSPVFDTLLVNDAGSGLHSGNISMGSSAVVKFRVRVNLMLDIPETPLPETPPVSLDE